jgi:hypothetical protein
MSGSDSALRLAPFDYFRPQSEADAGTIDCWIAI